VAFATRLDANPSSDGAFSGCPRAVSLELSPMSEGNMTNPFEDENGTYHVLINEEGQHSLWPSFVEVPNGWTIILKSDSRAACLEFINRNWTDMRPRSLIEAMDGVADGQQSRENQNGASAGSSTQGLDKRS
jgi:MbtH protein